MRRRIGWARVGIAVLWLAACGSPSSTTIHTAPRALGSQVVRFGGLAFDVPAAWSVYDLATDHRRCVRLDVHAVYLGHQGADADCPARVVGRTETAHLEPLAQAGGPPSPGGNPAPPGGNQQNIHGHRVEIGPLGDINHQIVAAFPADGLLVTLTYGNDKAAADAVLASARSAP